MQQRGLLDGRRPTRRSFVEAATLTRTALGEEHRLVTAMPETLRGDRAYVRCVPRRHGFGGSVTATGAVHPRDARRRIIGGSDRWWRPARRRLGEITDRCALLKVRRGRHAGIRQGLGADRCLRKALEVVSPADEVSGGLFGGQLAVLERDAGARTFRQQTDLDRAAFGRERAAARVAPRDAKAMWWVNLQVGATDCDAVDVDGEAASGARVKVGVIAHPSDHGFGVDEVLKHDGCGRRDVDVQRGRVSHHESRRRA